VEFYVVVLSSAESIPFCFDALEMSVRKTKEIVMIRSAG